MRRPSGPVATEVIWGSFPNLLFTPNVPRKNFKNKNLSPLKMNFSSPNFETWLRVCVALLTAQRKTFSCAV